ncbi:ribulose phosphate epimerase [Xenorhabdus vietnamensis]|uniref:Ribulose phosphate epimerase n=1 Tax=Xenorhabdus vietnamensis TaxID=351656 RepID=A0A1Y2SC78_9GAMM|nr:GFA family protein [Xenorhabdus vietnamensis]OTA16224.1 ribulose phosphate epimerase [Xenorhabdus vietnamensis]
MKKHKYCGGCLCGNIRFIATGETNNPHACSCTMCQRHTGALTSCWVEFPKEAVQWNGSGGIPSLFRSSGYSSRAFCQQCGSSLGAIDDGPTIGLLLGSFDRKGQKELRPVSHSYKSLCPRWWSIDVQS